MGLRHVGVCLMPSMGATAGQGAAVPRAIGCTCIRKAAAQSSSCNAANGCCMVCLASCQLHALTPPAPCAVETWGQDSHACACMHRQTPPAARTWLGASSALGGCFWGPMLMAPAVIVGGVL